MSTHEERAAKVLADHLAWTARSEDVAEYYAVLESLILSAIRAAADEARVEERAAMLKWANEMKLTPEDEKWDNESAHKEGEGTTFNKTLDRMIEYVGSRGGEPKEITR